MSAILFAALLQWNTETNTGFHFEQNTSFTLADSSVRMANVTGTSKDHKNNADANQPSPELVILFKPSPEDFKELRNEMDNWIDHGCKVLWVVDIKEEKVWTYDHGSWDELEDFDSILSAESLLPGFSFDLKSLRLE